MNITIIRNTAQTLTWTKTGDYSSDTIEFTVKADRSLTSARAIDKTASVSVSSGVSTFTVSLVPSDSASLSADIYYYDLRVETSSTDRESLFDGLAYLDKSVRNDTDGSSVSTASTVTTLTGADFDANDTLVSDGTDIVGQSVSEMKTLLGLPSKVYKAYINASGTSNPTATVMKNTLESDVAWTREDTGQYTMAVTSGGSPSGEFTSGKTLAIATAKIASFTVDNTVTMSIGTSSISFVAFQDGAVADSKDFYLSIEVYD